MNKIKSIKMHTTKKAGTPDYRQNGHYEIRSSGLNIKCQVSQI